MRSFFSQKQSNFSTIRLRVPVGIIYVEQLDALKEVAARYGSGRLHLTVRKTVEIPGVANKDIPRAIAQLASVGWYSSAFGDNIRNVVACPGAYSCPNAQVDTQSLGLEIDSNFASEEDLPAKIKIAVAGCPNSCTHPILNDIGIIGVTRVKVLQDKCERCYICVEDYCRENAIKKSEEGQVIIDPEACVDCGECVGKCLSNALVAESRAYRIFVGGKLGRHPQIGTYLADILTIPEVVDMVEVVLAVYKKYGQPGERLGELINRLSMERFRQLVVDYRKQKVKVACAQLVY
ncbi:hypothetical protein [Calderihabitans maritimus]|uniref:Sulfite reductase, beta subunit n=1 Tax=Calderihabitans maritimus TaxID=1246530 RepID=A0A1Z5HR34_9FIRM|nr:hypothetical protein [Calderihabitans maritimus]GAW91740.1 sulfite reductase, beta subunit [Calderihabitans maritimus]